jgi:hypothetical protein
MLLCRVLFCASLLLQTAGSISCYAGLKTPKTQVTPLQDSFEKTECGTGFDRCYELCTTWRPEGSKEVSIASDAGCGNREMCQHIHQVGRVGLETVDGIFWSTKFECCEEPDCNVG